MRSRRREGEDEKSDQMVFTEACSAGANDSIDYVITEVNPRMYEKIQRRKMTHLL